MQLFQRDSQHSGDLLDELANRHFKHPYDTLLTASFYTPSLEGNRALASGCFREHALKRHIIEGKDT